MSIWTNHVTVLLNTPPTGSFDPSNPTAVGTVKNGSAFTPTTGRLLVLVVAGPVTSSTPTGWTLPSGGTAVSTDGVYVFTKTAAGGDTVPAISHNSNSFKVTYDLYEFASTASFVKAQAFTAVSSGVSQSITGLTGTNAIFAAVCGPAPTSYAWTFSAGVTTAAESSEVGNHNYALGYIASSTASSVAVSASGNSHEQIMFAVTGVSAHIALSGEAFAVAGTMLAGTAKTAIRVSGEALGSTVTMLAGQPNTPVTVDGEAFAVAVTMLDGSAQTDIVIDGEAFAVGATFLDGLVAGAPIPGEAFVVSLAMLDGSLLFGTDTSNALNGLDILARGIVTQTRPVAAVPDTLTRATKVEKAIAYPAPTMDNGRPT